MNKKILALCSHTMLVKTQPKTKTLKEKHTDSEVYF